MDGISEREEEKEVETTEDEEIEKRSEEEGEPEGRITRKEEIAE
jgi:hypothetical protein